MTPGYTHYAPVADRRDWLVVSGHSFVVALGGDAASSVVSALWRLAGEEAASIESIVGAMPLAGAAGVRDFALVGIPAQEVGEDGRTITAVVRGDACVDVVSIGGARRFSSGGVQPWVLADFRSVTGFIVGGDAEVAEVTVRASAGSLALGDGVVHASRVYWSESELEMTDVERPDAASAAAAQQAIADIDEDTILTRALDDTIVRGPAHRPAAAEPEPEPEPEPKPEPEPEPKPKPEPGPEPGPKPEPQTESGRFGFRIVPGDVFELDAPTFFGRSPRTSAIASGVTPRLVRLASPNQQVSGTHLRIEQVGDSVVVTDLRSTNGTVVSGPGIPSMRLRPGESRVVLPGTSVDLGDGNIIEIVSERHTS